MKAIVRTMLVILMLTIAAGAAYFQDDLFLSNFTKDFDTAINIVSSPAQAKNNITRLQELSQKHNVSFIKDKYRVRSQMNGKMQIAIFVYLNDAVWFEKAFPNISFLEGKDTLNRFQKEETSTFLTLKEVELLPFSQINANDFTGDYHFRGTKDDIAALLEELNADEETGLQATVDTSWTNVSNTTESQFFLYLDILAIIIVSILFGYAIYNGQMTKELAVAHLTGWKSIHIAASKAVKLVLPSLLIAVLVISAGLLYVIRPATAMGYILAAKDVYAITACVSAVFFAVEFAIILLKYRSHSIILALKGRRPDRERMAYVLKIAICVAAMLMSAITIAGFQDHKDLQTYIPEWKKSADHVNISCGWPWTYVEDEKKFNKIVLPKLNRLWDELDSKGAIMFFAPNGEKEGIKDIADPSEPFDGKYAYVNRNYVDSAAPVDAEGRKIDVTGVSDNEWLVLYPQNSKPTESDMEKLKAAHAYESIEGKTGSDKFIPIKNGQRFITYDSSMSLDAAQVEDYTLIMVGGKSLDPTKGIKLPSLINGYLHPHVEDPAYAYEELKEVFAQTRTEPYILWVSSVYDDVMHHINEIQTNSVVNMAAFVLLLLVLIFVVRIDIESYLYHHGKRTDVSHLLGHRLTDIHGRKFMSSVIAYGISFALFITTLRVYPAINVLRLYTPRDGWTMDKTAIAAVAGLGVMFACFTGEIVKLCRNKKTISRRLKEGN